MLTSCIAIGLLFGIAALVLAILAYRKGQNKKTICNTLSLIGYTVDLLMDYIIIIYLYMRDSVLSLVD